MTHETLAGEVMRVWPEGSPSNFDASVMTLTVRSQGVMPAKAGIQYPLGCE
jgi:hypothetical protein